MQYKVVYFLKYFNLLCGMINLKRLKGHLQLKGLKLVEGVEGVEGVEEIEAMALFFIKP